MKRGYTRKLIYEFNSGGNCEVKIKNRWYRVTASYFRSFNGDRRVNDEPYLGPVYYYNTNIEIEKNNSEEICFDLNQNNFYGKKRKNEI